MQKLWFGSFDWDDRFPDNEWSELKGDIMECPEMEIPRRVGFQTQFVHVSLHVFSNASDLRTVSQNGQIWVHLITSKTRVAPLKVVSLPRLELFAALLATKLMNKISNSLDIKFNEIFDGFSHYFCLHINPSLQITNLCGQPRSRSLGPIESSLLALYSHKIQSS